MNPLKGSKGKSEAEAMPAMQSENMNGFTLGKKGDAS